MIAGIVDGSCSDCEVLNKTYYLSQDTPDGCVWSEGAVCGACDPTDIILTVTLDGSDYIITVTMDGHVWKKNYGTSKPECCELTDETIAHLTNSGDCDTSSATCVVTALKDGHPCKTDSCLNDCVVCENLPQEWAIDLGAGGWVDTGCGFCDQVQGVFVATVISFPDGCVAQINIQSVCSVSGFDYFFDILLAATDLGVGLAQISAVVTLAKNIGTPLIRHTYRSSTFTQGDSCFALADENGIITLSLDSTTDSNPGFICNAASTDPLPSTIQVWDANA